MGAARSNCVLWALALWWRLHRHGRRAYLVTRRSHWGPFPHLLVGRPRRDGRLAVVSYVPLQPRARWAPPVVFAGRVRWGDR